MTQPFSADEFATLRAHGFVLFADRVIFDAQPPMPEAEIEVVQAACSGPVPPQLLELWRITAGGALDYDLVLSMAGQREAVSWSELFWNGSEAYHDLAGWIEHELELAEEVAEDAGREWRGKLDALPFGGFEYCDRIYAVVQPGDDYGHVLAWKQGLPPAWTHRLHADALATIATDLRGAFRELTLQHDPLERREDVHTGRALLDYLETRVGEHGLERALADRLLGFYRRALADWRSALDAGRIAATPALALQALEEALRTDDAALVQRLARAGVPLDEPLLGSARPIEASITLGSFAATAALLDGGARVPPRALEDLHAGGPVEIARRLLDAGALPAASAIVSCAENLRYDTATLILRALRSRERDADRQFEAARIKKIEDLTESLSRVQRGKLSHWLGEAGLQQHIKALRDFSAT
jgi:hypothetical protein